MAACLKKRSHVLLGGAGWTPQSIAGLQLWLKADAIVGLSDGDPVATWPDSSGLGNNVTQSTPAARPLWKPNIQNGLPVVRFAGTDDLLLNTGIADLPAASMFLVVDLTSNNGPLAYTDAGGTVNSGYSLLHEGPSEWRGNDGGIRTASGAGATIGFHQWSGLHDNVNLDFWLDGAVGTPAACGPVSATLTTVIVGALDTFATFALVGDVAEVLVYNTALSAGNRAVVEAYLKGRWATP